MTLNNPFLLILGISMIGFLIPEFFGMIAPKNIRIPLGMNLLCSAAAGMITAAFV
jgi:hypothetical protein